MKIIVANHTYTTGPAQDLVEYLKNKLDYEVIFIEHPLFKTGDTLQSYSTTFNTNTPKQKTTYKLIHAGNTLLFVQNVLINIYDVIKNQNTIDIFIGSNNLNALSGVILKKLRKVKKLVYYVIDYDPNRFKNPFLNKIYHKIDQICVKNADVTWNLSPMMEPARKKYFNFSGGNQINLPVGMWYKRIPRKKYSEINKHKLAFMGHVIKKQGIQYVIKAIPEIIKSIPDFKFIVIGGGEYLDEIKQMTRELGLESYIDFTGYIEDHTELENILCSCGLGIALYDKYDDAGNLTFTNFADPMKLKVYMACGLPIILSDVPYNAKEIEQNKCGLIVNYDPKSIASAVIKIFKDENLHEKMRENAIKYSSEYNWDNIFYDGLKDIL